MSQRLPTENYSERAVRGAPLSEGAAAACRNCKAGNDGDRKFCHECGAPLYGPCPECGETTGLWEKFCGGCGFNLGATFEERLRSAQGILAEGAALRAAAQFSQAQLVLRRLAIDPDPLLHALRRRAEQELRQCEAQREDAVKRRDQLLVDAQQALHESAYERAVALLDQIPEGVRNEDVQHLFGRARAFREECDQLLRTIREALAAKEYGGLLPQVERLLILKPYHQQARGMLTKLRQFEHQSQAQQRDRNHDAAKRKLGAFQYDEALALLEEIKPELRTPDIDRTLDFARETAWLARQLRSALVATETLVRLGERLKKLKPEDQEAAKCVEQLKQRRAAAAPPRFAVPLRATPPNAFIGCQVEYPEAWKHVGIDPAIAAALGPRLEQFFIAAGFALEGLGKAVMTPNFESEASGGIWKRLSRAVRKRDGRIAWGLDLGDCSLKAIRLRLTDDGKVVADAAEHLAHERPLSEPGVDAVATLRATWRRLSAAHDLSEGRLCGGFSGQSLLSRSFKLPPSDEKQIPALVKYEAAQQIPVALDQVAWDYHLFGGTDAASRFDRAVVLFAVKRMSLAERLAQWEAIDARLDVLQADCVGLHNLLAFEGMLPLPGEAEVESPDPLEEDVTMALDIGANACVATVGNTRNFWSRVLPGGGAEFTRALVRELTLTVRDAERLKRQPYAAAAANRVDRVLQGPLKSLAAELARTMTYYASQQRRRRISRILLLGGGARLHGLYDALWRGVG